MILNENQLETAHKIVKLGLQEATKSLEFFTKSKTRLDLGNDFKINKTSEKLDIIQKKEDKIYLLTSTIMGDLKGIAYLLFSEEEVKTIMKSIYPNKEFDTEKYIKKSRDLILEVDNVITASVVTQFANYFDYKTYGGVPQLDIVSRADLEDIIKNGITDNNYVLDFKAQLISESVNVNAEFIWFVDDQFIEGVIKSSMK
jgi:chemotaxis protein CheY-P-specific phosphatase CheC